MANSFYTATGTPNTGSSGSSALMRAEFDLVQAAFDLMPTLSGNGGNVVVVDPTGSFLTSQAAANAPHAASAPTTGFSIALSKRRTVINPVGTLATGTVVLPAAATDGDTYIVCSTQQVTALTVSAADSATILCAPTFLSPGTPIAFVWDTSTSKWYPT